MWNKLTLRAKIAALTALTLGFMCACLTAISIYNSDVFYEPIEYIGKKPVEGGAANSIGSQLAGVQGVDALDEIYLGSRSRFQTQSVLAALGVTALGTVLSWLIAGSALRPIGILAARIEGVGESNLSEPLPLPPARDEVASLTRSFNAMLEKLDRSFEAQRLFASNAAHELKTPLTNILATIEVMDESPDIDEYREVIGVAKENAERLTALVSELLRFNAQLDDALCADVRSDSLFEKLLSDLAPAIAEKRLSVAVDGSATLRGDAALLERAFFNLLQNAVRYNKESGSIKISAHAGAIVIEDSGVGIPRDSLSQIFDPFYCVDRSRSRALGGSGLGLSIAKQIFDRHGMAVSVASEPGKGTKIRIETHAQ